MKSNQLAGQKDKTRLHLKSDRKDHKSFRLERKQGKRDRALMELSA
jgi:hypothetical protein